MRVVQLYQLAALATSCFAPSVAAAAVAAETYDYIVVGSGAGGIATAAKLSASGKKTLLIERGPVTSGRWGGTKVWPKPAWLQGTNLTRFDVPGLYNIIWEDNAGIKCPDVVPMAGCVLGGGTAINAGLWWKPQAADWDVNFPEGWKAADLEAATERVFSKIPWTDHPSQDGILYNQQGADLASQGLEDVGWKNVTANLVPNEKNRTFSHSAYFYIHGERGGPLATYLVDASARSNFKLAVNTTVARLTRDGGHITGVQVEASGPDGLSGKIALAAHGRVVLSAGVFNTAKILFRSGIGPTDQLKIVKGVDGSKMIDKASWIDLPVGYNLDDHVNTNIQFAHPDIVNYDFNGAYTNPVPGDAQKYLANRTGILAMAAPNINPIVWEGILGSDSIARYFQWTGYVSGPATGSPYNTLGLAAALGLGKTSRGRITINSALVMNATTLPYFNDQGQDRAAVISTVTEVLKGIAQIPNATIISPPPGQSVAEFFDSLAINIDRTANHWVGTAHLGTDSGLKGGKSVVDLNAQVYGTDNLHIIDASIINGITTSNPQSAIVIAAEKATDNILKL